MQKYNGRLFEEYKPEEKTLLKVMEFLNVLNYVNEEIVDVFGSKGYPNEIFIFIESKYSSKIEGIYTGLFNVVNTGKIDNNENEIKPLVEMLLSGIKQATKEEIIRLGHIINAVNDESKRWDSNFGIYETIDGQSNKIYEPPLDKGIVRQEIDKVITFNNQNITIDQMIMSHLWFEKIHPFVDGNGRIGRIMLAKHLGLQKQRFRLLPMSWTIFKNKQLYYDSFDFQNNEELNQSIRSILDILISMSNTVIYFVNDVKEYIDSNLSSVMKSSSRIDEKLARQILLNLQTKASYLINEFGLNPRTVSNIFENLRTNDTIDFNEARVGREKVYWNISLEAIIDNNFNG